MHGLLAITITIFFLLLFILQFLTLSSYKKYSSNNLINNSFVYLLEIRVKVKIKPHYYIIWYEKAKHNSNNNKKSLIKNNLPPLIIINKSCQLYNT